MEVSVVKLIIPLLCISCIHLTVLDSGKQTNNVTIRMKADIDPSSIPLIIPMYICCLLKEDPSFLFIFSFLLLLESCEAMDELLLNDVKLRSDVKLFNVTSEHGHANGGGV